MRQARAFGALTFIAVLPLGCSTDNAPTPPPPAEPTGAISGLVRTADEAPIVGARVTAQPDPRVAVSDAEGRFMISDLAPGTYALHATAEGFVDGLAVDVEVVAEQTVQVDLELDATPAPGPTCITCHLDLDRLYVSLEEDPLPSRPHEGGSAGEG